jgi:hypothetical protein
MRMPELRRYVLRSLTDQSDTVWVNKDDLLQVLRHGLHGNACSHGDRACVDDAIAEVADIIERTVSRLDRSDPLNAWVPPGQAQPCTCRSAVPPLPERGVRAILAAAWSSSWSSWAGTLLRVSLLISGVLVVLFLCLPAPW